MGRRPQIGDEAGTQIAIRVPPDALRRADTLRPRLARDQTLGALGKVTRSTVLKLAMVEGLAVLEQRYK